MAAVAESITDGAKVAATARASVEEPSLDELLGLYPLVLSNKPGIHQATGGLRQWLCTRTNLDATEGVILVTADHAGRHEVLQYRQRLKVARINVTIIEATLEDVARAASSNEAENLGHLEPAQRLALDIFRDANQRRASDVHIQVKRRVTLVRYRVLGRMKTYRRLTREEGLELLSAIYNTMTYEQEPTLDDRKDQGAQLRESFARSVGLATARIATRPSVGKGMRFTIRLIRNFDASQTFTDCGYHVSHHVPQIDYMLERAFGMILITGVTGSGKSQTLAVAERHLADASDDELNIMTIEDPTEGEINRESVCQTPLIYDRTDPKAKDRAWPLALSSLMRHDPDVIAPGEVRDGDSARGAAEAALTGHLVMTTLHVQEANAIPERLRDLGVSEDIVFNPAYLVGLINQSLVPVLCHECRRPMPEKGVGVLTRAQYERLCKVFDGDVQGIYVRPPEGTECAHCNSAYHTDRTIVAEVLTPTAAYFRIYRKEGMLAAKSYAVSHMGFKTKIQHALERIKGGYLDPRDAQRVLGPLDLDEVTTGIEA